MSDRRERENFSKAQICDYWFDRHPRISALEDVCWCCGRFAKLDRAHIDALCDGGTDTLDNIQLLCRNCHNSTEGLGADRYWKYLEAYPYDFVGYLVKTGIAHQAANSE